MKGVQCYNNIWERVVVKLGITSKQSHNLDIYTVLESVMAILL